MTNREWLNTLTDKEFAKWSIDVGCGMCVYNPDRGICKNLNDIASFEKDCCIDGMAKWLQMEHKGE